MTERQLKIIDIVKEKQPIIGEDIAKLLGVSRSALRTDFSFLTKSKILQSKIKKGYSYLGNAKKMPLLVNEIMSSPIMVDFNHSVYDTIVDMFTEDVGNIFVTQNNSLVGVVSRKDLLKNAIGKNDITKIPVSLVMTRVPNVIYTEEKETILEAVKKIINHQIDALPVVKITEKDNKTIYTVVGRVTKTNTTKLLMDILENKF